MKQGQTSAAGKYGRYRILAEVGRGRTGVVYKAEDPIIGRTVALKVLVEPSGVATDERMAFRARLRAEAELAGVLHHPHIVTLYDVGDEFLVMEFLEGRPLGSVIAQDGPLDPARALRLGRQLAQALDFAHARGIVHRALRPRNVMVLHSGDVKVMDFGIASPRLRAVVPDARLEPDVYLAPERRAGRRADARSDVYSLGVVMHELLTGLPPATEAAASAGAAPATGSRMEAVVRRALSPEPSDRYASAGDFVAALEAAIAQEEHPLSRLVASSVPPAADEPP